MIPTQAAVVLLFATTLQSPEAALKGSASGRAVSQSFVERRGGMDRDRNARKVREACNSSERWDAHEAVADFML